MSLLASNDPKFDGRANVSIDQKLAYQVLAPQSAEYLHPTDSLHVMRKGFQKFKNYSLGYVDVAPLQSAANINAGDEIEIRYGNEGFGLLAAAELIFDLPLVTGTAATYCRWRKNVGEILIGAGNERFEQGLASTPCREYRALGIHIKRALCQDALGSSERTAYLDRCNADNGDESAAAGSAARRNCWTTAAPDHCRVIHDVWLPWGRDKYDRNQTMPMHAFGSEFYMRWRLPQLAQLVESDATGGFVKTGSFNIRLRLHYIYTERAERAHAANQVLSSTGHSYLTFHLARETPVTAISDTAQTVPGIDIKNAQSPVSMLVFVVRAEDDLESTGTGITDANLTRSPGGVTIEQPNEFNFLSWDSCWLTDTAGNKLTAEISRQYMRDSGCFGLSRFFPKQDRVHNIGVIPFGHFPGEEGMTAGQMPFKVMNQPQLHIKLPNISVDGEGPNQTRRIDVFYLEPNTLTAMNGHMYTKWKYTV